MLRLARGTRLQHVILNSFPSRGNRPAPIWDLRELEPDTIQRQKLQRLMEINEVTEVDFLRWRNACVAPNISDAFDFIRGAEISTPLWVTSHILRRKIHNADDASLAAHLALLAVPSNGSLVSAHETPLILSLETIARYGLVYALPSIVSRVLALPTRNHQHLVLLMSSSNLAGSPLVARTLQAIVQDIMALPRVISRDLWLQVWERWGENRVLGEAFSTWLQTKMREQGISPPPTYHAPPGKLYTIGAKYFGNNISRSNSTIESLRAATQSKNVSGRLLLAIAHSLIHGFYPRPPDTHKPPDEAFIAMLIDGLIERKSYERAKAIWKDAERNISQLDNPLLPTPGPLSHRLILTSELFNAGLSAYASSGDLRSALNMLDNYASLSRDTSSSSRSASAQSGPRPKSRPPKRSHVTSSALNMVIPHLPPHAQYLIFTHSAQRWGIQPDSLALEMVMQDAFQVVRGHGQDYHSYTGDTTFGENLREFGDGLRQILNRQPESKIGQFEPSDEWGWYEEQLGLSLDPSYRTRDRDLIRRNAIELFQKVVLGNWPFIAGLEVDIESAMSDKSQNDDEILAPRNMALFVPRPLRRKMEPKPTYTFKPCAPQVLSLTPLHPSPTPCFPNAHPTARAWSAYLGLLSAQDLPKALGWMRAADESMQRPDNAAAGTSMFRPDTNALIDVLIRWEAVALSQETLVERALHERKRINVEGENGIGPEGALRAWLVDWLGPTGVPSREEVARARLNGYNSYGRL